MQDIKYYKNTFDDPDLWFEVEVKKAYHVQRIARVIENKLYLEGNHQVINREDAKYKGKELITRKIILNYMKTILKFHCTYLTGNAITITGDDSTVKGLNQIYKEGLYRNIDYRILDRVLKFGDAYEFIYVDDDEDKTITKSKVLDSANSYPVYSDTGDYIAFIEHWIDGYSNISYFNVFYPTYMESWNNEGGIMNLIEEKNNIGGLPIHYHNYSDIWEMFGSSMIDDCKPLLDELEDMYSKLGDAIYVNSLNPMPVAIGQRIEGSIPADATGYVLNIDMGDYKVVSTMMDYQTIKLHLDNIKAMLNDIANLPNVIGANTNVANVSEVSLKLLFHMADMKAMESEQFMREGITQRFNKIKYIQKQRGIDIKDDDISISFNYSRPVALNEILANLKVQYDMGAISKKTIIEKSPLTVDTQDELDKIQEEQGKPDKNDKTKTA